MATKSSNTQGNPYHDEATGEFTSAGSSSATEKSVEAEAKPKLENKPEPKLEKTVSNFKFKLKANIQVDDFRKELQRNKQVSSIPFLGSASDIEEHLEEFFPDDIISNIDSKFGKFAVPYKYFNLRTDPQQRCGVNIFAACIGKKRWPNNYMRLIDINEYVNLSRNPNCTKLYRGLHGDDRAFETIANSYSSKENEMIYGSVGGTCYGIAVYASDDPGEARSYAGGNRNHVMNLILNRSGRTMSYHRLCQIRNDLMNNKDAIRPRIEKMFVDKGVEPNKAKQMAISFTDYTLADEGFVAMLCGVEWYQSGSYHMIENLGTLFRLL